MIVTVANVKGGVAKTTTAMHLAAAMHLAGRPVVVIDADAQGSAIRWAAGAKAAGEPLPHGVESLATKQLALRLDDITAGRHAVIDCGPGNAEIITAAIDVADVVVIPCNASEDDTEQARTTVSQCHALDIPAGVLLSRIRASESLPDYYRAQLVEAGAHVFRSTVPELVRIRGAFGGTIQDPSPFDQLLAEIDELTQGEQ